MPDSTPRPRPAMPRVVVDMKLPQIHELATQLRFAPGRRIWMMSGVRALAHSDTFADPREELLASLHKMTRGLLIYLLLPVSAMPPAC